MRTVLMVAEKPSLAQSIAKILSKGHVIGSTDGACSVHEMTSVVDHVMTELLLCFSGKVQQWDKVTLQSSSASSQAKKEPTPKLNMVKFLWRPGGCDYVVLWLDCDKEGENICFEVIQVGCEHLHLDNGNFVIDKTQNSSNPKRTSSDTNLAVLESFHLQKDNENPRLSFFILQYVHV
uniref:DNA topoisomerase n=1 Tax=Salarias fasciatus TaxID=181472 RepID=A0A672HPX8_SALFA